MDEKLLTRCPACSLQLEVKLAWIGRSGTCKCGEKFYIEPSVALKESPREADEQSDAPVHIVDAADIFGADDMSPEENFRRTIRLTLQDEMVSIDEQILLENLAKHGAVQVNDRPIALREMVPLEPGMKIQIGETPLRFESAEQIGINT